MPARIDFDRLRLRARPLWTWQLHENQSFLGRLVMRLNRASLASIADLSTEEWLALHSEVRQIELWLTRIFVPDRFNYAQLGNIYPQLHIHVVPRYRDPREWGGVRFVDPKWGRNWAPTPRSPLSLSATYDLASWLRRHADEFFESFTDPLNATATRVPGTPDS
jgi:diadenosine tetraphosphate (Ap4A) HIT family hydrolase